MVWDGMGWDGMGRGGKGSEGGLNAVDVIKVLGLGMRGGGNEWVCGAVLFGGIGGEEKGMGFLFVCFWLEWNGRLKRGVRECERGGGGEV